MNAKQRAGDAISILLLIIAISMIVVLHAGSQSFSLDGYSVVTHPITAMEVNHTEDSKTQYYSGYTRKEGVIHLLMTQTIWSHYTACTHEKLHNEHPEWDHSRVYKKQYRVDSTCLKVVFRLLMHA